MTLTTCIRAAGVLQLGLAALNLLLPGKLGYRRELAKLSPLVRQIFIVHSAYIGLVLLIFGAASLGFAAELSKAGLGRFLSGALGVFWTLRLPIQLFYYDREVKRQNPLMDLVLTVVFGFLAAVFSAAALGLWR
jgi:hypothetical protein